ncbi:MAG: hypothetical protein ACT4QG_06870 [Sporichthyaceae bacterium]
MSADDAWTTYSDERGFAFDVPGSWEVRVDPRADVAVVALDPVVDDWGFRTNVLVTLDQVDRGMTLAAWQEGAEKMLGGVLQEYLLLDLEDVHVGERAGIRRLAHHNAEGRAITMEQWTVLDGRRGFTLTASVSTLAYPRVAPTLARIGDTLRVGAHA